MNNLLLPGHYRTHIERVGKGTEGTKCDLYQNSSIIRLGENFHAE